MRAIGWLLALVVVALPVVAQAQPASVPPAITRVGSWGTGAFPGALVRPDEVYAFVWWTGAPPAGNAVRVDFPKAGGGADASRPGEIACTVAVATIARFEGPETIAVARIKLAAAAPEGIAPLSPDGNLSGVLAAVDAFGRMVPAARERQVEVVGWFPRLTFIRWRGEADQLYFRFAVIDQAGKLAGFGVKLAGGEGGAAFALPQHQCLPR